MLQRAPYLQRVTPDSATLLFTADTGDDVVVDVLDPDTKETQSVTARLDGTAALPRGHQLEAQLGGLEPGKLYCYALRGLTDWAGFTTAPARGANAPVRFVAMGDSGTGGREQLAVMQQMESVPFDFMIHTGDVAYEKGKLSELETLHFGVYSPLLRMFPFFPASGNHDYGTDNAAPFRQSFALPENGGPYGHERWYSFDWGNVHFVALDTELSGNAAQEAWLDADLTANDLPWTIVYMHRPPYSSGAHGSHHKTRDSFGPILERHGVKLVLNGHEHNYERTKPISGVHYIVTGGGGRETRSVGSSWFSAFAEPVLHFVYVEVRGNRLSLHAIDGVGREFDQLVLHAG